MTGQLHNDKEYFTMKGWVYVISNQAMNGLVKVGYSTKDPELRAEELNHTGSPHPYVVEYEVLLENPYQIEQKVHKLLKDVHEGKEWFRCSIEEAIAAIYQTVGDAIITENFKKTQREKAEQIYRQKREQEIKEQEIERQKKEQEIKEREIKEKLRDEENRIKQEYEKIIATRFTPRPSWQYWLGGAFLSIFGMAILFPIKQDEVVSVIVLGAIVGGGIGLFVEDFFEGKRKKSPEYKALIEERDNKLANFLDKVITCSSCQQSIRFERWRLLSYPPDTIWSCPKCKAAITSPKD